MDLKEDKYSVLEQHSNGDFWYHPGWTYSSQEEAENKIREFRKYHENRPMCYIVHKDELPQESCICWWLADNVCRFTFAGGIKGEVKISRTGHYEEPEPEEPAEPLCKECKHLKMADGSIAVCVLCGFPIDEWGKICISFEK